MLTDRWLPIKDAANAATPVDSARLAMDALATFETFQITHPTTGGMVLGKLGQILDALITDGLLAAPDKACSAGNGIAERSHVAGHRHRQSAGRVARTQ